MTDTVLLLILIMLCVISYQITEGNKIMATLKELVDGLSAKVAANTTVIGSVEQLLTNIAAVIADLKTQLQNAGVDPAILTQIDALQKTLDTDDAGLAAAVLANTPPTTPVGQG